MLISHPSYFPLPNCCHKPTDQPTNQPTKQPTPQNGCICCTLRGDLLQEVAALAAGGAFEYLVIESTVSGQRGRMGLGGAEWGGWERAANRMEEADSGWGQRGYVVVGRCLIKVQAAECRSTPTHVHPTTATTPPHNHNHNHNHNHPTPPGHQ